MEWWLSCFLLREGEWRSGQILNLSEPSHVQSGDLSLHASPRPHTEACRLMHLLSIRYCAKKEQTLIKDREQVLS